MRIETLIRRREDAQYASEYGVRTRRLFPWPDRVNTRRPLTQAGCMYVLIGPGEAVAPHRHDEEETFIVLEGSAVLEVDGQRTRIAAGDVAYIPRHAEHALRNESPCRFQMLDVYWDEHGRSDASLT
jgi:mannose-6-phosphate isomerase-like protein (cupin superfamily)